MEFVPWLEQEEVHSDLGPNAYSAVPLVYPGASLTSLLRADTRRRPLLGGKWA